MYHTPMLEKQTGATAAPHSVRVASGRTRRVSALRRGVAGYSGITGLDAPHFSQAGKRECRMALQLGQASYKGVAHIGQM